MSKKPKEVKTEGEYTAKDIYVLEGLDPVRKRPAMYIGSTGPEGVHHLIWEVVDNSLDEAMGGYAKNIEIILLPNNRVKVTDDGRGIPVDVHKQTKKSALETVLTTLHAGGKFGGEAYKISGGLHGVGVSVVCALSSWMRAEVCREGFLYVQEYSKGKPKANVKKDGKCKKTGTTIIFEPDSEIFKEIKFDLKKVLNHLRQQAYLTKGIRITITDQTEKLPKSYTFYFEGGINSYVEYLIRGSVPRHPSVFYGTGEKDGILVEGAFQYTQEYECYEESFANNIYTGEGGTHLTGFRTALTRTFNDFAKKNGYVKGNDENLSGEDIREGLTSVVSVKIREPQFEGQTKAKLGNQEAKPAVEAVIAEALADFLERNPQDAKAIIEKCIISQKARVAAKSARETVLRKGILDGLALPGKLADCSSNNPEESEIYIVEGESAGGCFAGDTEVALTDGRNLTFKELVEEDKIGKKNYCYTVKEDGFIGMGQIKSPRLTKRKAEVIKIIFDNGKEIICTPDHKFMLRSGDYKMAKELTIKDSLKPLYRKFSEIGGGITIKGYEMVFDPKKYQYIFSHLLADRYNIEKGKYVKKEGQAIHHSDLNKLNNYPDNIIRIDSKEHRKLHSRLISQLMSRPEIKEKLRKIRQSKEFREKIRNSMLKPEMRKMLSERAKKQWENKEYKEYMAQKFLEFYGKNKDYREKNSKILYENQKKYWSNGENRNKQAEKIQNYFREHPEAKENLILKAKLEWKNQELLAWRGQKTREQWTQTFREKRKATYNQTYKEKALKLMKNIFDSYGRVDEGKYNQERMISKDRSILRYSTISQRFFDGSKEGLEQAVSNYNHKIKKIIRFKKRTDVYDIEVEGTHNFALAAGMFVHNSAKGARDRRFQAILPLRGKILNVERARLDKMLASKEIKSLIIALGTAVASDFNLEKLRYHRIIIMSDADSDGNHIRTLLLTLFYRYFQPIIEAGYLYIAQPPLYRIQSGKEIKYAYAETQKETVLNSMKKSFGISIQRYKGLGEMNTEQLWETTMDPQNRILLQVNIENAKEADRIFDVLMGDEVFPRKKFIQTYAKKAKNLDI
jgi:DNA gyrase subunit B